MVDPDNEAAWCACDRSLVWCLVLVVLVVALVSGGLPTAHADTWDDAVDGNCPEGQEYRGYHRVVGPNCPRCVDRRTGEAREWTVYQGGCRHCPSCVRDATVCPGTDRWPTPVCVDSPGTPDEEADQERLGDILGNLGGYPSEGGNPFGGGGAGDSVAPLSLFGDPVGAVEADDIVPQAETSPGSGEYSCPAGTTLIDSGDDEGLCRVSDQCAFYGATGGTWPACSCSGFAGSTTIDSEALAGYQWVWDRYALRCMPGERAQTPVAPLAPSGSLSSRGYLWNLICGIDTSVGSARGWVSAEGYLTQSSPEFVVRRGGVEAIAYNSAVTLSTDIGDDDWTVSSDEASDEDTFGSVMCEWLAGPMSNVEQAFAGFGIARRANSCPTLSIPFFSQSIRLDIHCTLIGRWLGLIQAIAVVSYSFLGMRYIWGMKGFAKPVQST